MGMDDTVDFVQQIHKETTEQSIWIRQWLHHVAVGCHWKPAINFNLEITIDVFVTNIRFQEMHGFYQLVIHYSIFKISLSNMFVLRLEVL